MTSLSEIQAGWDQAAREDAMFNIVTFADKANGRWTPEEFFAHGRAEIDAAISRLADVNLKLTFGRALDFGCGVGRLTQSLAWYFRRVDGVDVSEEMIFRAKLLNKHPRRVEYWPSRKTLPFREDTFDFVYTMITLQHMPKELQRGYVREFFRVLKPGGVAMFEIPEGEDYRHPNEWLSMYGVDRTEVESWIAADKAKLVDVEEIPEPSQWKCYRYTAVAS